jgi:hypothetical protein
MTNIANYLALDLRATRVQQYDCQPAFLHSCGSMSYVIRATEVNKND